jgi:hypothetical protein
MVFMAISNVGNSYTCALNTTPYNNPFFDNMNPPLLYQSPSPSHLTANIIITSGNDTWVDLVLLNPRRSQPPHPIHTHSNRAFIIDAGEGYPNWSSVSEAAKAIPEASTLLVCRTEKDMSHRRWT